MCSKLTKEAPDFTVFDGNFEYIWQVVLVFLADSEHVNAGWNTLLP